MVITQLFRFPIVSIMFDRTPAMKCIYWINVAATYVTCQRMRLFVKGCCHPSWKPRRLHWHRKCVGSFCFESNIYFHRSIFIHQWLRMCEWRCAQCFLSCRKFHMMEVHHYSHDSHHSLNRHLSRLGPLMIVNQVVPCRKSWRHSAACMAVAFGFSSTGGWSKISAKVLWTFSCNSSIVNSSRCCNSWSCAREFLCTIVGAVSTRPEDDRRNDCLVRILTALFLSCTGFGFLFILLGLLLLFGLLAFFCWDFLWRAAQSKPEATSRSPAAHSLWLAPAGAQHKI